MKTTHTIYAMLLLVLLAGCKSRSAKQGAMDNVRHFKIDTIVSETEEAVAMPAEEQCMLAWMQGKHEKIYQFANLIIKAHEEVSIPSSIVPSAQPRLVAAAKEQCGVTVNSYNTFHAALNAVANVVSKDATERDASDIKAFSHALAYYSAAYCRHNADEIMRKYPELYHSADKVQRLFNKWQEREREYFEKVLVGIDTKRRQQMLRQYPQFCMRLESKNIIEALYAALSGQTDAMPLQPLVTAARQRGFADADYTEAYRKVMFTIPDGLESDTDGHSTAELRSACEKARKAWIAYTEAIPALLQAVPEASQQAVARGETRLRRMHIIDLYNCYAAYWAENNPLWILRDASTDEQIDTHRADALQYLYAQKKQK